MLRQIASTGTAQEQWHIAAVTLAGEFAMKRGGNNAITWPFDDWAEGHHNAGLSYAKGGCAMTTRRRSWTGLVWWMTGAGIVTAGLLLPACQSTTLGDNSAHMRTPEAVQHPMLGGIPLPRGFSVLSDKSKAWESGRYRFASYEFIGSVPRDTVHEFFLNHMPTANFKLLQRRDDRGEYILNFASNTEECAVRIGTRQYKTYFVVDVGPKPQGATREGQDLPPPRNP